MMTGGTTSSGNPQFAYLKLFGRFAVFFLSLLASPLRVTIRYRRCCWKFRCVQWDMRSHGVTKWEIRLAADGFRCRVLLGKERGPKLVGLPSLYLFVLFLDVILQAQHLERIRLVLRGRRSTWSASGLFCVAGAALGAPS